MLSTSQQPDLHSLQALSAPQFVGFAGFLSGILGGLCFPPCDLWPLAWVALVPLCFVLTAPRMTRQVWAGVYLGGLAFHLLALSWLRTSYESIGYSGPYFYGWLVAGQIGAFILLFVMIVGRRFVQGTQLPMCWSLPIVWVSFELLRQGSASLLDGAGTPWFQLAVTQVNFRPIAQVADLGGAPAIMFLVAAGNGLLFDLLRYVQCREPAARLSTGGMTLAALLLIAAFSYGSWRLNQSSTEKGPVCVLMSTSDLPPLLLKERLEAGDRRSPDLLIWPELAYHHKLVDCSERVDSAAIELPHDAALLTQSDAKTYSQAVRGYLTGAAREFDAGVLIGCERLWFDKNYSRRYNSFAYAEPTSGYQGCYDKRYLVPWSEFIPRDLGWLQVPGCGLYESGNDAPLFSLAGHGGREYRFGTAICYDVAFAEHFRHLLQQGKIDFVVQCGSENRDDTGSQSLMMLRMAQLRAIEIHRSIVRNVHRGHSAVIDANGRLLWVSDREPLDRPQWVPSVPIDTRESFYARAGDWPAVAALLALAVGALRASLC